MYKENNKKIINNKINRIKSIGFLNLLLSGINPITQKKNTTSNIEISLLQSYISKYFNLDSKILSDGDDIEVPFEWYGDAPAINRTFYSKDGRQHLIFEPTKATISYEKVPEVGGRWSWKFNEDITQQDNGYKGNFWNEPYDYYSTEWFRDDGFGVGNLVEVTLHCVQMKNGNGWWRNIEDMHLLSDDEEPAKSKDENPTKVEPYGGKNPTKVEPYGGKNLPPSRATKPPIPPGHKNEPIPRRTGDWRDKPGEPF